MEKLSVSFLCERAAAEGVDAAVVEAALNSDNPQTELARVITDHLLSTQPQGGATAAETEPLVPSMNSDGGPGAAQPEPEQSAGTRKVAVKPEGTAADPRRVHWTFACVLEPDSEEEDSEEEEDGEDGEESKTSLVRASSLHSSAEQIRSNKFRDFVVGLTKKFHRAGLEMQLVERSPTSAHACMILLRCPEAKLLEEFRQLGIRRWKSSGQGLPLVRAKQDPSGPGAARDQDIIDGLDFTLSLSEADRIQITAMLLSRPESRGGCGLGSLDPEVFEDSEDHDPRIRAVFPLRNHQWYNLLEKRWNDLSPWGMLFAKVCVCSCQCAKNCRGPQKTEAEKAKEAAHIVPRDTAEFGAVHEDVIHELQNQFGTRVAFLFVFIHTASNSLFWLAMALLVVYPAMTGTFLGLIEIYTPSQELWEWWLRLLGLVGLFVPAIWPAYLFSTWDKNSKRLSFQWGASGVKEPPTISPYYIKHTPGCKHYLQGLYLACAVCLGIVFIFFVAMFILETEVIIQNTPACDSWFYENVWKHYVTFGSESSRVLGIPIAVAWPLCYPDESEDPPSGRFIAAFTLGIIEAIFIGVIFTELFGCLAERFAIWTNQRLWRDHEAMLVNSLYPFEAGSNVFYFFILAFVFVPFGTSFQASLFATEGQLSMVDLNISPAPLEMAAPCRSFQDGVCDEWRGTCRIGTDKEDCAAWGCTDKAAMNYDAQARQYVETTITSRLDTRNGTRNFNDRSWGNAQRLYISDIVELDDKFCKYDASKDQSVGLALQMEDMGRTRTTCPTVEDGKCDEPVTCLLDFPGVTKPEDADIVMKRCLGSYESRWWSSSCDIGTDVKDCEMHYYKAMYNSVCDLGKRTVETTCDLKKDVDGDGTTGAGEQGAANGHHDEYELKCTDGSTPTPLGWSGSKLTIQGASYPNRRGGAAGSKLTAFCTNDNEATAANPTFTWGMTGPPPIPAGGNWQGPAINQFVGTQTGGEKKEIFHVSKDVGKVTIFIKDWSTARSISWEIKEKRAGGRVVCSSPTYATKRDTDFDRDRCFAVLNVLKTAGRFQLANAAYRNPSPRDICEYILPTSSVTACANIGNANFEGIMFPNGDKDLSFLQDPANKISLGPKELCETWAKTGKCRNPAFIGRMNLYCSAHVNCDTFNPNAARLCLNLGGGAALTAAEQAAMQTALAARLGITPASRVTVTAGCGVSVSSGRRRLQAGGGTTILLLPDAKNRRFNKPIDIKAGESIGGRTLAEAPRRDGVTSFTVVEGPCETRWPDAENEPERQCVGRRKGYKPNEKCVIAMEPRIQLDCPEIDGKRIKNRKGVIQKKITNFNTEPDFDVVTIDNLPFSGRSCPGRSGSSAVAADLSSTTSSVFFTPNPAIMSWESDSVTDASTLHPDTVGWDPEEGKNTAEGSWEICAKKLLCPPDWVNDGKCDEPFNCPVGSDALDCALEVGTDGEEDEEAKQLRCQGLKEGGLCQLQVGTSASAKKAQEVVIKFGCQEICDVCNDYQGMDSLLSLNGVFTMTHKCNYDKWEDVFTESVVAGWGKRIEWEFCVVEKCLAWSEYKPSNKLANTPFPPLTGQEVCEAESVNTLDLCRRVSERNGGCCSWDCATNEGKGGCVSNVKENAVCPATKKPWEEPTCGDAGCAEPEWHWWKLFNSPDSKVSPAKVTSECDFYPQFTGMCQTEKSYLGQNQLFVVPCDQCRSDPGKCDMANCDAGTGTGTGTGAGTETLYTLGNCTRECDKALTEDSHFQDYGTLDSCNASAFDGVCDAGVQGSGCPCQVLGSDLRHDHHDCEVAEDCEYVAREAKKKQCFGRDINPVLFSDREFTDDFIEPVFTPWSGICEAKQKVWAKLGWNKLTWDGEDPNKPPLKSWAELSESEKTAAQELEFTESTWFFTDQDMPGPYSWKAGAGISKDSRDECTDMKNRLIKCAVGSRRTDKISRCKDWWVVEGFCVGNTNELEDVECSGHYKDVDRKSEVRGSTQEECCALKNADVTPGYYEDSNGQEKRCTPIRNAHEQSSIACFTADDSVFDRTRSPSGVVFQCANGFGLCEANRKGPCSDNSAATKADKCTKCPDVENMAKDAEHTCTTPNDSQVSSCVAGYTPCVYRGRQHATSGPVLWDELCPSTQKYWKLLGWQQCSFDGSTSAPASDNKKWITLNITEQEAAKQLGYADAKDWDGAGFIPRKTVLVAKRCTGLKPCSSTSDVSALASMLHCEDLNNDILGPPEPPWSFADKTMVRVTKGQACRPCVGGTAKADQEPRNGSRACKAAVCPYGQISADKMVCTCLAGYTGGGEFGAGGASCDGGVQSSPTYPPCTIDNCGATGKTTACGCGTNEAVVQTDGLATMGLRSSTSSTRALTVPLLTSSGTMSLASQYEVGDHIKITAAQGQSCALLGPGVAKPNAYWTTTIARVATTATGDSEFTTTGAHPHAADEETEGNCLIERVKSLKCVVCVGGTAVADVQPRNSPRACDAPTRAMCKNGVITNALKLEATCTCDSSSGYTGGGLWRADAFAFPPCEFGKCGAGGKTTACGCGANEAVVETPKLVADPLTSLTGSVHTTKSLSLLLQVSASQYAKGDHIKVSHHDYGKGATCALLEDKSTSVFTTTIATIDNKLWKDLTATEKTDAAQLQSYQKCDKTAQRCTAWDNRLVTLTTTDDHPVQASQNRLGGCKIEREQSLRCVACVDGTAEADTVLRTTARPCTPAECPNGVIAGDYTHKVKGCVNKSTILHMDGSPMLYRQMTLVQCKRKCDKEESCKGFEFGVAHCGSGKYFPGDCQLKSSADTSGCSGSQQNLDFYTKVQPSVKVCTCNAGFAGGGRWQSGPTFPTCKLDQCGSGGKTTPCGCGANEAVVETPPVAKLSLVSSTSSAKTIVSAEPTGFAKEDRIKITAAPGRTCALLSGKVNTPGPQPGPQPAGPQPAGPQPGCGSISFSTTIASINGTAIVTTDAHPHAADEETEGNCLIEREKSLKCVACAGGTAEADVQPRNSTRACTPATCADFDITKSLGEITAYVRANGLPKPVCGCPPNYVGGGVLVFNGTWKSSFPACTPQQCGSAGMTQDCGCAANEGIAETLALDDKKQRVVVFSSLGTDTLFLDQDPLFRYSISSYANGDYVRITAAPGKICGMLKDNVAFTTRIATLNNYNFGSGGLSFKDESLFYAYDMAKYEALYGRRRRMSHDSYFYAIVTTTDPHPGTGSEDTAGDCEIERVLALASSDHSTKTLSIETVMSDSDVNPNDFMFPISTPQPLVVPKMTSGDNIKITAATGKTCALLKNNMDFTTAIVHVTNTDTSVNSTTCDCSCLGPDYTPVSSRCASQYGSFYDRSCCTARTTRTTITTELAHPGNASEAEAGDCLFELIKSLRCVACVGGTAEADTAPQKTSRGCKAATCPNGVITGAQTSAATCTCNPGFSGGGRWQSGPTFPTCVVDQCGSGKTTPCGCGANEAVVEQMPGSPGSLTSSEYSRSTLNIDVKSPGPAELAMSAGDQILIRESFTGSCAMLAAGTSSTSSPGSSLCCNLVQQYNCPVSCLSGGSCPPECVPLCSAVPPCPCCPARRRMNHLQPLSSFSTTIAAVSLYAVPMGQGSGGCWANNPKYEAECEHQGYTSADCPKNKCHWNSAVGPPTQYGLGNSTGASPIRGMCAGNTDAAEDVKCPEEFVHKYDQRGTDVVKCCVRITSHQGRFLMQIRTTDAHPGQASETTAGDCVVERVRTLKCVACATRVVSPGSKQLSVAEADELPATGNRECTIPCSKLTYTCPANYIDKPGITPVADLNNLTKSCCTPIMCTKSDGLGHTPMVLCLGNTTLVPNAATVERGPEADAASRCCATTCSAVTCPTTHIRKPGDTIGSTVDACCRPSMPKCDNVLITGALTSKATCKCPSHLVGGGKWISGSAFPTCRKPPPRQCGSGTTLPCGCGKNEAVEIDFNALTGYDGMYGLGGGIDTPYKCTPCVGGTAQADADVSTVCYGGTCYPQTMERPCKAATCPNGVITDPLTSAAKCTCKPGYIGGGPWQSGPTFPSCVVDQCGSGKTTACGCGANEEVVANVELTRVLPQFHTTSSRKQIDLHLKYTTYDLNNGTAFAYTNYDLNNGTALPTGKCSGKHSPEIGGGLDSHGNFQCSIGDGVRAPGTHGSDIVACCVPCKTVAVSSLSPTCKACNYNYADPSSCADMDSVRETYLSTKCPNEMQSINAQERLTVLALAAIEDKCLKTATDQVAKTACKTAFVRDTNTTNSALAKCLAPWSAYSQSASDGGGCWANKPEYEAECENRKYTLKTCPTDKCHWNPAVKPHGGAIAPGSSLDCNLVQQYNCPDSCCSSGSCPLECVPLIPCCPTPGGVIAPGGTSMASNTYSGSMPSSTSSGSMPSNTYSGSMPSSTSSGSMPSSTYSGSMPSSTSSGAMPSSTSSGSGPIAPGPQGRRRLEHDSGSKQTVVDNAHGLANKALAHPAQTRRRRLNAAKSSFPTTITVTVTPMAIPTPALVGPRGIAEKRDGTFALVADTGGHRIRKVTLPAGTWTSTWGTGTSGNTPTQFNGPQGITIYPASNFALVADTGNHLIRKINLGTNAITTLAGSTLGTDQTTVTHTTAKFNFPSDVALAELTRASYALVADRQNHQIRMICIRSSDTTCTIGETSILAGGTEAAAASNQGSTEKKFNEPSGVALYTKESWPGGTIGDFALVVDSKNHRIMKVMIATKKMETLAGGHAQASPGWVDASGFNARFKFPEKVQISSDGVYAYICDTGNERIRRVHVATKRVTTLAGRLRGASQTTAAGVLATFRSPTGITVSTNGNVVTAMVADRDNNVIRKLVIVEAAESYLQNDARWTERARDGKTCKWIDDQFIKERNEGPSSSSMCIVPPDSVTNILGLIQCSDKLASNCVAKCSECIACMFDPLDVHTPSGAFRHRPALTFQPVAAQMFCQEYQLCTECVENCKRYRECFDYEDIKRASADAPGASGTACERMGRLENGWCDEDEPAFVKTNPSQTCLLPNSRNTTWTCPVGEDRIDCTSQVYSNRTRNTRRQCNVGCKPPCEEKCLRKYVPEEALFPRCVVGCEASRSGLRLDYDGTFRVNGTGKHIPVLPTREVCHLEKDNKLGWGLNPESDIECVDCKSYCSDQAVVSKWSDATACENGCMASEDVLYDESARVHYSGACKGENEMLSLVSHMVSIWMFDKLRIKLQVADLISMPLILAVVLPMILEVVFSGMCQRWQTVNRRRAARGCCLRWCCCRRRMHSADWAQPRGCCTRVLNCFMCDEDAGTGKQAKPPVLLCTDAALAKDITEAIGDPNTVIRVHKRAGSTRDQSKVLTGHKAGEESTMSLADSIILQAQQDPISVNDEYMSLGIILLSVSMWTMVSPYFPFVAWLTLHARFRFDISRFFKFYRRPIPVTPFGDDLTGGYMKWFRLQSFLSILISGLLFVMSTGILEAYWELWDEQECQATTYENGPQWKFPACDPNWKSPNAEWSESIATEDEDRVVSDEFEVTDELPDENIEGFEPPAEKIMMLNYSCWRENKVNLPTLPPCGFQADSDYISTVTEMSSKGFATRLMVFFIVEHIQFCVFIMTTWWSSIISKDTQKKVQYFHDTQHALLADVIFPTSSSSRTAATTMALRAARQWRKLASDKKKRRFSMNLSSPRP